MESKIVFILAIIAHTIWTTNSMPTKNVPNLDSSISLLEISTSEPKNILESHTKMSVDPEVKKIEESAVMEKRSIEKDEKNENVDEEKGEANLDDLETAAGTNILRPLFVYRQQLAYRERVRKAGRRAVPNF